MSRRPRCSRCGLRRLLGDFCCLLCGLDGGFGGLFGGLNGFLRCFHRTFCRFNSNFSCGFCRLLDILSVALKCLDGFFSGVGRVAQSVCGFLLHLLFRNVRLFLPEVFFRFGDVLFGCTNPTAALLVKLMDGFTGGALGAARDTVCGVFIRRIIRRINTVFCFIFGTDIGVFHSFGSNRRFVNRLNCTLYNISRFYVGHSFTSNPSRASSSRRAE